MLNKQIIKAVIAASAQKKDIWVAYSGGVDSHVLLHLLATANNDDLLTIHAIHIDHGLNSLSHQWTQHCADIAAELKIDFTLQKVKVDNIEKLGMEAAAREARYQALEKKLGDDDILLTAQHQHDQAETLLLQLLRGAGPKGLSAMAEEFNLGNVHVFRPLLNVPQTDILAYATQHKLKWIEDPSNIETRWNRNYIRHKIWPELAKRWPSAAKTLSRSAEHCAEASELLDDLAASDLASFSLDDAPNSLPISELLELSSARRNNLLRYFIRLKQFSLPSSVNLQRIIDEVCLAKQDSEPLVSWDKVEVRRFHNQLYFMATLAAYHGKEISLNNYNGIRLDKHRRLEWKQRVGVGIKQEIISSGLTLRFRQGGERIKSQGSAHHSLLKHLFQQWAIPPWQRNRIPLLFSDDKLIAVIGYCISDEASVKHDQKGYFPVIKVYD